LEVTATITSLDRGSTDCTKVPIDTFVSLAKGVPNKATNPSGAADTIVQSKRCRRADEMRPGRSGDRDRSKIMENQIRVVALVGSLRRESYTRRVVNALIELAPEGMAIEIAPIASLPLFNEDDDTEAPPPAWQAFRDQVRRSDAVLFATPEYNRSIPGALKNAIDVGSRPAGASVWARKPAAVLSASPGALGGFGANHHVRQCLTFLDMPVLQQPEAYLGRVAGLLDADGRVTPRATADFLKGFMGAFERWIRQLQGEPATASARAPQASIRAPSRYAQ
jgi:chromate reductase